MYTTIYREVAVLLFFILDYSDALPGKICKVPNADAGTCTAVNKCDPLYALHKKRPKTPQEEAFFRQSVASCGGSSLKVCCPPPSQWSRLVVKPVEYSGPQTHISHTNEVLTPSKDSIEDRIQGPSRPALPLNVPNDKKENQPNPWLTNLALFPATNEPITEACGIDSSSGDRIVGGNATLIDEHPWLVLLEYDDPINRFRCGGSLISRSHVLTAAHCLYILPIKVRLSEYNLTTEPTDIVEVNGQGEDSITVEIMDVEWAVQHRDHQRKTSINDIGLIKMKQQAVYGDFIKPICLPTIDYRATNFFVGTFFTVAGWGSDNAMSTNSEVKRSVYVPYVPMDICSESYSALMEKQHLCAGGKEGMDSCRGDSGGPLMYEDITTSSYVIVGIVSSGKAKCGTKGSPAIYTYVYEYLDWIDKMIKNNGKM